MPSTRAAHREQAAWKLVSTLSGVAGAVVTRKVLEGLWPVREDGVAPPFNPADRRVAWSTSLQWAVAAGIGAGITRLLGQRLAAAGWERATGAPPPGIRA